MKVGIVGMGYVGTAVWDAIANRTEIEPIPYDTSPEQIHFWGEMSEDDINTCDIAFVCVPTPTDTDGNVDCGAVRDVLGWLTVPLIVIRSTMSAQWDVAAFVINQHTGRHIVYQPEFIGESSFAPWREETDVGLVVAGGERAQEVIDFWKPILGPRVQYIATDWRTAAEIKYAVNCHGAIKAAWWREYLRSCENPDVVRNACMAVPWIEPYHTLPIGEGIGGKCFPKDLRAWASGKDAPIAEASLRYMDD